MSDRLRPPGFESLARWVLGGLRRDEVLDLPRETWFTPLRNDSIRLEKSFAGKPMATPFGVAAGPQTQLATGIVASWLAGARILELKTVQHRAVEVARPCIRIRDEGLNVEWSQELTPEASFEQYLDAWVMIHALHHLLGWPGDTPETVFDISVGYDLEGLLSPPMQDYLSRIADAEKLLGERLEILGQLDPQLKELKVPRRLASSATISTMHGCPVDEIGGMATHLMEKHGLHVRVKLNPTLLGAAAVREVLHEGLGWRELIPDEEAFAHDLDLDKAVELIAQMKEVARGADVRFGVKLSNTLPLVHEGTVFPASERTMYLSGRPLHALTVQTTARLDEATGRELSISFCGGADCFNLPDLAAAGLLPVTVCSDLLRPGGVGRLSQYGITLRDALAASGAEDLESFALARARRTDSSGAYDVSASSHGINNVGGDFAAAAHHNLQAYVRQVLEDARYRREARPPTPGLKGTRPLGLFDCIHAPCVEDCGIDQDVPEYMRRVEAGDFPGAAEVIRRDNALASSLGRACHHPCETRCTREAYEAPLAIRHIKRFALEAAEEARAVDKTPAPLTALKKNLPAVAVVGAGPCGLAAALDLRRAGVRVTVLEARAKGAGMVTDTIPAYRAPDPAAERDLEELRRESVEIRHGVRFPVDLDLPALKAEGFGAVVLAVGAQRGRRMGIPGEEYEGVMDGLELLRRARRDEAVATGEVMAVVGGGDVAIDCARSLRRLAPQGRVEILYRRRVQDMPASAEELHALRDEGIPIRELLVPVEAIGPEGKLEKVVCIRLRPGEPGADGRPHPEPTGETVDLPVNLLVVAIGQEPAPESLAIEDLEKNATGWVRADPVTGRTSVEGVWAGGDVSRGPSSLVAAAGDGRHIAADILKGFGLAVPPRNAKAPQKKELTPKTEITPRTEISVKMEANGPGPYRRLMEARARRTLRVPVPELPPENRRDFAEVVQPYTEDQARTEAARCLECDLLCSTCVTVCPNRAFLTLEMEPFSVHWKLLSEQAVNFTLAQPFQTVVLNDLCNACGNCTEFCPTAGKPYEDKPRLVIDADALVSLDHNVVLLRQRREGPSLHLRWHGEDHRMEWGDPVLYTGPRIKAQLEEASGSLIQASATGDLSVLTREDWEPCFHLFVLGRGLIASRPELLDATAQLDPRY